MKYVYNPKNRQINPATAFTSVDPSLRSNFISEQLYALVCKGKVSANDIGAMLASNKSPELLVKEHNAVKDSPITSAPDIKEEIPEVPQEDHPDEGVGLNLEDSEPISATGAFDGKDLNKKKQPELLVIASTIGIDVNAEDFNPTRNNLLKAINDKVREAEEKAADNG